MEVSLGHLVEVCKIFLGGDEFKYIKHSFKTKNYNAKSHGQSFEISKEIALRCYYCKIFPYMYAKLMSLPYKMWNFFLKVVYNLNTFEWCSVVFNALCLEFWDCWLGASSNSAMTTLSMKTYPCYFLLVEPWKKTGK